jgi:membrane-associated protease RseP (regulator of RpoE activity)
MSRLVVSFGMVALFVGALTIGAQVREDPRKAPAPGQKNLAPGRSADKQVPDGKQPSAHKSRNQVYLGVFTVPVEDISRRDRRKLKLKDDEGVYVVEVMDGSPAENAGLQPGDVILRVNGKSTDDEEELSKDLNEQGPGKPVKLDILRDGKKKEITATLAARPVERGHEEVLGMCQQNAERIEQLEHKIARLEKRLRDMEKTRSAKAPE